MPVRFLSSYLDEANNETHTLAATAYGSPKCGSCWKLQYDHQPPVFVVAVDNAAIFQLGKDGFAKFAGQKGFDQGSVDAKAVEVSPQNCGLPPPKW